MFMLDTNICVYLIKQSRARVVDRLRDAGADAVSISAIVLGELEVGVAKSARREQAADALAALLAPLRVVPFEDAAAEAYGSVRADLERRGTPIGSLDMLIAGHALSLGRTLVTNNEREFSRVTGLKIENWTR